MGEEGKYRGRSEVGTTIRMSEKVTRNCTRYLLKITQPMIHVNSVYKYKYKYVVLINFLIWADSASSKNQRSLNKSPNTRHEKPPLSCWLELPKRCSRHSSHYCCPWLSPRGWRLLHYWRQRVLQKQGSETHQLEETWMLLQTPSTIFHGAKRYQTIFQRMKTTNSPIWLRCYEPYQQTEWHNNTKGSVVTHKPRWQPADL